MEGVAKRGVSRVRLEGQVCVADMVKSFLSGYLPVRSRFGLTSVTDSRQGSAMAVFPVPRYLAETASREDGLRDWIAGLPGIVAGLADRWSLSVGEPFQLGRASCRERV